MVLSGSKKTSSLSSIKNAGTNGGSKKAGLVPTVGTTSAMNISRRSLKITLLESQTNKYTIFPNQNLPIGFRKDIRMY
jgi:hypothetical protein